MLKSLNTTKIMKMISILMIAIIVLAMGGSVLATAEPDIPSASKPGGNVATTLQNIIGSVIYVVQMVAFAAAVILLMVLAIKYLTASPDGKAEIKKSAVIYLVGAVILFAAGGILTIIRTWTSTTITS